MSTHYELILNTCSDKVSAEKIARLLVEQKLAACVNIVPNISSIYSWQSQIESATEFLLLIKAPKNNYQAIETTIKNHHSYELPEIIAVPIEHGLPEYLHWIDDTCH